MEQKFVFATDSGCDLTADVCRERAIYPLMMRYEMDGADCVDTMRPEDLHNFFTKMGNGSVVHTSAVNVGEYLAFWPELLKQHLPIVHLTMGSGISGTYQNALLARDQFLQDHPEAELYVVDSLGASMSYGMLALAAADLRDEGKTAQEAVAWLEENRLLACPYYTTGDLSYLYRGGRVSRAGMVVAHTLNIWPILNLNPASELKVVEKCRGRKRTYARIAEIIRDEAIDPQNHTLYVCHADDREQAEIFAEQIRETAGFKDIFYSYIGTIIGAHTGPGLVSAYYYGNGRKRAAEAEKK